MRLWEIFEQTITPVPPGQGGILPPTTPIRSSMDDQNDKDNAANNGQQNPQIRSSLNKVKGTLNAAGGGNIDVNKLTDIMSKDTNPNNPMNPIMVKSLQSILPGIGDALQDPQSSDKLAQAIKSGVLTHDKKEKQQKDQEKQQAITKSQQMGVNPSSI